MCGKMVCLAASETAYVVADYQTADAATAWSDMMKEWDDLEDQGRYNGFT